MHNFFNSSITQTSPPLLRLRQAFLSIALLLSLIVTTPVQAKELQLCVDSRNWYPFSYVENGTPRGIHVDIVAAALTNLGYSHTIIPYPRKRCLVSISKNWIDAAISLAYNQDLEDKMVFPADASTAKESKWRIMQVDHMFVTTANQSYRFKGDISNLPSPVRIPAGESLFKNSTEITRMIDSGASDGQSNMLKLLRDQKGSVIITSVLAEKLLQQMDLTDKIIIHPTPISSRSYHLVFSHGSNLTEDEKITIWAEIARLREDYIFILQLFSKY